MCGPRVSFAYGPSGAGEAVNKQYDLRTGGRGDLRDPENGSRGASKFHAPHISAIHDRISENPLNKHNKTL